MINTTLLNEIFLKRQKEQEKIVRYHAKKLGLKILHLRKKREIPKEELARLAGISRNTLTRIEKGRNFKIYALWKLSSVLDIKLGVEE